MINFLFSKFGWKNVSFDSAISKLSAENRFFILIIMQSKMFNMNLHENNLMSILLFIELSTSLSSSAPVVVIKTKLSSLLGFLFIRFNPKLQKICKKYL